MAATNVVALEGAELLRARLGEIPDGMRAVLRSPPAVDAPDGPVVVTGVGASEGPARTLVAALGRSSGLAARYAPLSAFFETSADRSPETLVVFSQQLSPNARMALASASRFRRTVLFTSSTSVPPNVEKIVLPPEREEGALLRIVGPAVASFAAVVWAERGSAGSGLDRFEPVIAAVRAAEASVVEALAVAPADALSRPVAFVTSGDRLDAYRGVATKWLEGTGLREPPVWDVLSVPHGPFHQLVDQPTTFVTLEPSPSAGASALFDRLQSMVAVHHHALVRLRSSLPAALAPLDHDAQVDALLVRAVELAPHDLRFSRSAGLDAPLYGIDRPVAGRS